MRRKTVTIPAAFQLLDTLVTTADTFVNVRDLQVARLNHNILLAKRVGNTLFSRNFSSISDAGDDQLYTTISTLKATHEFGAAVLRCKVLVPLYVKQLRLRFRACWSALDQGSQFDTDPIVYADVWNPASRKVKMTLPSATRPALTSMLARMRAKVWLLLAILSTGMVGKPMALPRPLVKAMRLHPPAARPASDGGSYPGVFMKTSPGVSIRPA
jgi:hypothetical protein